jgi:alpha-D-ribose 1-methylphosphonate 5-triphosphate synthase subunit PhnH
MATTRIELERGFHDSVADAQRVFRRCLTALSRPCLPVDVATDLPAVGPLLPATAAFLLAFADHETSVWLDPAAHTAHDVGNYIRFHTGARLCGDPKDADFAVVVAPEEALRLDAFKQGTPDYPDASATVLVQVKCFREDTAAFRGPGIVGTVPFWADPLPGDFAAQLDRNHKSFPCGVDVLLFAQGRVVGLSRSAKIEASRVG